MSFSARFRHRLLRAAGIYALTAPALLGACADEVIVLGPAEDDDGSGPTSSSTGGPSTTVTTSTGQGGFGGFPTTTVVTVNTTTGVGGAPPSEVVCWDAQGGPCPDVMSAQNVFGPCTPDFNDWVDQWLGGPYPGPNGTCCYEVVVSEFGCGVGRPYLQDDAPVVAPLTQSLDWPGAPGRNDAALSPAQRAALRQAWAHDGQHEHASIASFARVALELMAVGAPPARVDAAHRAARDEVEHARLCFALASRFGEAPVGPGALPLDDSVPLKTDLVSIAASTAAEGCIGETLAVAVAQAQLEAAADPEVRHALATVVEDEMRHAELAWRTVAWAIRHGGAEVRAAVEAVFATAAQRMIEVETSEDATLGAYGRLDAARAGAVQRRALVDIVLPCAAALLSGSDVATVSACPATEMNAMR